jgi:hypothetical protein
MKRYHARVPTPLPPPLRASPCFAVLRRVSSFVTHRVQQIVVGVVGVNAPVGMPPSGGHEAPLGVAPRDFALFGPPRFEQLCGAATVKVGAVQTVSL